MNTPTPSAHSGEQGKPSDASIGKAFVEVVGNWSHRRAKETFNRVLRRASEIECRNLREQEQRVLRAQDQLRKSQDNLDATARELERKHEQSEPEADDYREVMSKLSGPLRSIWAVMGPRVPRHWDCGGAAFEWGEALRILRDAANNAPPPSEQAGISDGAVDRAAKIIADHVGHGMREKCERVARDVLQSAFPRGVGSGAVDGCPCVYTTPCSDRCSCADSFQSGGCARCCKYGSAEQRKAAAIRLAHPAPEAQAEGGGKPVAWMLLNKATGQLYWDSESCVFGSASDANDEADILNDDGNEDDFIAVALGFFRPQPSASETPSADAMDALPPLDDDLRDILGRPNFACIRLANLFRKEGAVIASKAEDEQAHVIHWMLGLRLKHGRENWREHADRAIDAAIAAQRKEGES